VESTRLEKTVFYTNRYTNPERNRPRAPRNNCQQELARYVLPKGNTCTSHEQPRAGKQRSLLHQKESIID
jgi:hypothetical protein